jgi:hypothetical protein
MGGGAHTPVKSMFAVSTEHDPASSPGRSDTYCLQSFAARLSGLEALQEFLVLRGQIRLLQ